MGFRTNQKYIEGSEFKIHPPFDPDLTVRIHNACQEKDDDLFFSLLTELEAKDRENTDIYTRSLALRAWIAYSPGSRIRDVDRDVYCRLLGYITFSGILYDLDGKRIYYHSPFLTSLLRGFSEDDCFYFWELTPKESRGLALVDILEDHKIGEKRLSTDYTVHDIVEKIIHLLDTSLEDLTTEISKAKEISPK